MIEYPVGVENPPKKVRAGQRYIFRRSGMDRIWSEHCPGIEDGTPVVVTQLPSSPKPGTMGQVHISDLDGNFLGMCSVQSLQTQTDELERSGQVKMVRHNENPPLEILSDRQAGDQRIVHYRITVSMQGTADAEKILHTLYPQWRVASHYSLKKKTYPGITHAYAVSMRRRAGVNPPVNKTMERWNRHAVALLMRLPGVKYAEVGRMGTKEWFFDIEDEEGRHVRREFPLQADLAVAIGNLIERVGKNPPLPASALMDISTAKITAREVEEGLRPMGNLGTVDHLLDRGLQKLRGSHLGQVDWSNPPRTQDVLKVAIEDQEDLVGLLVRLNHRGIISDDELGLGRKNLFRLRDLKFFIKHDYEKNPPAAHPQTEIYRDIVEIRAIKPDGKRYVHKFGKGSNIYGMSDGTILIRSRKGKRLWKNFKVEG